MKYLLFLLLLPASEEHFEVAQQLFQGGVEHMENHRFPEAIKQLRASLRLRESPPALFNLGVCCERTREYECTVQSLERFLALSSPNAPGTAEARALVKKALSKVAIVQLSIEEGADRFSVNGASQSPASGEHRLILNPGEHELTLSRASEQTRKTLRLTAGQQLSLSLRPPSPTLAPLDPLPTLTPKLDPPPPPTTATTKPEEPSVLGAWWLWTTIGLVVAATATGVAVAMTRSPTELNCGSWGVSLGGDCP